MREVVIKSELHNFKSFNEFAKEFYIDEKDLILTSKVICDNYLKSYDLKSSILFYDDFGGGEPTEKIISEILEVSSDKEFQRVIAIGGGAILDIGKIVAMKKVKNVKDLFMGEEKVVKAKTLIAIPTTCGTGSEFTNISVSVLDHDSDNITKLGLVSDELIPDVVVWIPELLKSLPYKVVAISSLDALIHAIESYLSPNRATTTSEMFSLKAIEIIIDTYNSIKINEKKIDENCLENLLKASSYAGIAFLQGGCGTIHALSFPLGGKYKVPHGEANYVFFKSTMMLYEDICPQGKIIKLKDFIANKMNVSKEDAFNNLFELLDYILKPKKISDFNVELEELDNFRISVWQHQQRLIRNSYIPLNCSLIKNLYNDCYK